MGRTVRTYRDGVRIEEERWKDFRRTLRPSQRDRFDRIFDYARGFADAGTMMVTPRIIEVILLSALLEMLGELDEIRERVQVLEKKIEETTP
ncbi:MAG: hypothetical protein EAX87_02860 [Candidatus Thorarchaeota archaeon]|nr:hypothetical protein [Candidatus Thorarchaeota archaeon]